MSDLAYDPRVSEPVDLVIKPVGFSLDPRVSDTSTMIDGTPGNDILKGTQFPDLFRAGDGNDKLSGRGDRDVLNGEAGDDLLNGEAGNDLLDGGRGFDILTGGTGNDFFQFRVTGPADLISDFNVANDTIELENSVFTKLSTGTLSASQFRVGTHAVDSNDYLIYNKAEGKLSYDADGSGVGAATLIANVNDGLNLANNNILVTNEGIFPF